MLWKTSLIPTVNDPQGSTRLGFVFLCLTFVELFQIYEHNGGSGSPERQSGSDSLVGR